MEEKKVIKRKKSGVKKVLAGFLAVVLIIGATVAATLAFLDTVTEPVTNTFTASGDIKLGLDEPGYNLGSDGKPKNPASPNPANYQPGETYAKDPTLYNLTGTNKGSFEWVAMKVKYMIDSTEVTQTQLTTDTASSGLNNKVGLINAIGYDGTNWIKLSSDQLSACGVTGTVNYEIYVYKHKLKEQNGKTETTHFTNDNAETGSGTGGKTTPLFSSITVKDKITLSGSYTDTSSGLLTLPEFKIEVKGAAIKHDDTVSSVTSINSDNIASNKTDTNDYKIVKALVDLLKDK